MIHVCPGTGINTCWTSCTCGLAILQHVIESVPSTPSAINQHCKHAHAHQNNRNKANKAKKGNGKNKQSKSEFNATNDHALRAHTTQTENKWNTNTQQETVVRHNIAPVVAKARSNARLSVVPSRVGIRRTLCACHSCVKGVQKQSSKQPKCVVQEWSLL